MNAKAKWKRSLPLYGSADSGFEVPLGSYPEVGGDDDGFRPMELMAVSLAGCTAMDVISNLTKKCQAVSDFQVKVETERSDQHPKVFTKAIIEYHVAGKDISETAVTRAMKLSADTYCPAQAMIGKIIPLTLKYFIYEGDKIGDGKPIIEGLLR